MVDRAILCAYYVGAIACIAGFLFGYDSGM